MNPVVTICGVEANVVPDIRYDVLISTKELAKVLHVTEARIQKFKSRYDKADPRSGVVRLVVGIHYILATDIAAREQREVVMWTPDGLFEMAFSLRAATILEFRQQLWRALRSCTRTPQHVTMDDVIAFVQSQHLELVQLRTQAQLVQEVAAPSGDMPLHLVAKALDMAEYKPNCMNSVLRSVGVLQSRGRSKNIPYQKYVNAGYFRVIPTSGVGSRGATYEGADVMVTPKGFTWLKRRLMALRTEPTPVQEFPVLPEDQGTLPGLISMDTMQSSARAAVAQLAIEGRVGLELRI